MFDSLAKAFQQAEKEMAKVDVNALVMSQPATIIEMTVGLERAAAALRLAATARASEMHFWERLGYRCFEDWLAATTGTSPGKARRQSETAKNLADHDDIADALADGEISEDDADVVTDAASKNPDAEKELLDTAKNKSKTHNELKKRAAKAKASAEKDHERFERLRKGRTANWGPDREGFWGVWGKLQPHIGAQIKSRLDAERNRLFTEARKNGVHNPLDWYRADALAAAILGFDPDTNSTTVTWPEGKPEPATPGSNTEPNGSCVSDPPGAGSPGGSSNSARSSSSAQDLRLPGLDDPTDPPNSTATVACNCATAVGDPTQAKKTAAAAAGKEIVIVVDLAPLRRGCVHPGETCEIRGVGPVPVEVVRTWMDDAFIKAVIKDGSDIKAVSHFGRHINARFKTALDLLDPVCAVPNCDNPRREYDHKQPHGDRENPGPTSLDNLRPPCGPHHKQITHHGYRLEGEPGDMTWHHPDGRILAADNPRKLTHQDRAP